MNEKPSQDLLDELTAGKFTEAERAEIDEKIDRFVKFIKEISYAIGLDQPLFYFQFMRDYLRCSTSNEELESRIEQILEPL